MPTNTKARHEEIYTAAVSALEAAGGVLAVDQLEQSERLVALRSLYKTVADSANCHIETARKSVAQAMRRARFGIVQNWGGERPGAGRPSLDWKVSFHYDNPKRNFKRSYETQTDAIEASLEYLDVFTYIENIRTGEWGRREANSQDIEWPGAGRPKESRDNE